MWYDVVTGPGRSRVADRKERVCPAKSSSWLSPMTQPRQRMPHARFASRNLATRENRSSWPQIPWQICRTCHSSQKPGRSGEHKRPETVWAGNRPGRRGRETQARDKVAISNQAGLSPGLPSRQQPGRRFAQLSSSRVRFGTRKDLGPASVLRGCCVMFPPGYREAPDVLEFR